MSALESTITQPERRDELLDNAFLRATDGVIVTPNTLQHALFPRLMTQDTGLLVQTEPCAGRLEAVYVPFMTAKRDPSGLKRLYVIVSDECVLDDYIYRLSAYLRGLAVAENTPFTLFIEDDQEAFCRQYLPDGTQNTDACKHLLDAGVDLGVATFSRFCSLFFGAGGIHALPALVRDAAEDYTMDLRDLFYFDEAQSYGQENFSAFVRLVEFLFAEDLDVVVGATTLPPSCLEELSFFEDLTLPDAPNAAARTLCSQTAADPLSAMEDIVRRKYYQNSRVFVVLEEPEGAEQMHGRLSALYPQNVFCYHAAMPQQQRLEVYAQMRELEKEGEGYLLAADGYGLNNADLDATVLVTGLCAPETLLRRAGRCNRRGEMPSGEVVVVATEAEDGGYRGRTLPPELFRSYLSKLRGLEQPAALETRDWKQFIM